VLDRLILGAGGDISRTENKGEENVNSSLVYTSARWEFSPVSSVFLRLEQVDDELDEATRSARISFEVGF
jgi:hypothetical protein